MHDIKRIREKPEEVGTSLQHKGYQADVDALIKLDMEHREKISQINRLRAELNIASKNIGKAKKAGQDAKTEMEEARKIRNSIVESESLERQMKQDIRNLLLEWPAEPSGESPVGRDESENEVLKTVEHFQPADFELTDHLTIAESLGILDMERGAKITGSAWPVYIGLGATLERALINYMLNLHITEHGYREIFPPFVVNRNSVLGTGQLPKLEDDMYYCERDDLYLIPTAEVPLTNLHGNEILRASDLPKKYVAYSACFRREAGAYGADTRGLLRIHQFNKVELVQIVPPEESEKIHREILEHATVILDRLGITYRIVELCTGELSFAASRCYDIEVWAPGCKSWLEASSVSNFRDFQARRMNLRYRPDEKSKPLFPHTLNGSALATSRLMVALIETYQTPEGRIRIPAVLQPYMNGIDQIRGVDR